MTRSAAAWGGLALSLVLAVTAIRPARASAQDTEPGELASGAMDLHLFRPSVDPNGHFAVNGTDILGHNDFSFGLTLDAGFRLLPFKGFVNNSEKRAEDANRKSEIVDQLFTGTLHFNYGIADWVVVGIQFPVQVVNGSNIEVPGFYNSPMDDEPSAVDYQGLGDFTIHAKVRWLSARTNALGLATVLHTQFPTGDEKQFASEGGVALWPVMVADWLPIDEIRLSLNVGYRFQTGTGAKFPIEGRTEPDTDMTSNATMAELVQQDAVLQYDDLVTFGFGASFTVAEPVDLVAELYGSQIATEIGTKGSTSIEALGGFKFYVDEDSYLMIGGGGGLPPLDGFQRADFRAMLGFVFEPSIGDIDGDGIADDQDKCPKKAEDRDGFQDADGCPDLDNDNDGILDEDDSCPMVPEDKDGDEDQDGCPEGSERDSDGDGILDSEDECPNEPEDKDGFQDADGCPDPDNDGDGILDNDDLCPNEPEDEDGFEDEDGCPDEDNDEDRIMDVDDECPDDPETYNGTEDEDGCPDKGQVVLEEDQLTILKKIHFETDSARIKPESDPILEAVAATLKGNPQITLVEVQGHADERGPDRYNLQLTKRRAASVVDALVQRGVSADRLRSAGYGERCPVAEGSNPEAWGKNRRVEFKIVETEQGRTDTEITCEAGKSLIPE